VLCCAGEGSATAGGGKQLLDGEGRYHLVAIISHMGANTGCGHYVAHVKKDNK
jgi:ubiquitin carboxyl-terminal hydrolase 5/13